jgi:radical SAM protein with 4Fe4S-binding SPASM domain
VLERIIKELAKFKCSSVIFVGGDPASNPKIVELANTAKSLALETGILSNTLFFANRSASEVTSAFNYVEATIHRPNPETHDSFCQREGAYDFVIKNLKSLKSASTHLGIVYNITPDTYQDIFKTIKRVIEFDRVPIDHVVLQRIVSVGRAVHKSKWNLTSYFLDSIFTQVQKAEKNYKFDISFEDTFPLCKVHTEYHKYIHPCSWGQSAVSLDMYGNIAKCCTDPRYEIGNILDTPLDKLWNSSIALNKRRSGCLVPQSCRDCPQYERCGGGCILASEMNGCNGDPLLVL